MPIDSLHFKVEKALSLKKPEMANHFRRVGFLLARKIIVSVFSGHSNGTM